LVVGTRLPAYATAAGHVLLAALKADALQDYFSRAEFRPLTEHTLTTRAALTQRLALVRSRGWDAVNQELEIGPRSAAAPIRDASGGVIAALSFSRGTSERSFEQMTEAFLPALLQTAAQPNSAFGADGYAPHSKESSDLL
jgi:IclR family transcriptional regulator, pca regulon regulatory protein